MCLLSLLPRLEPIAAGPTLRQAGRRANNLYMQHASAET
jgi:hypothetical protein